MNQLSKTCLRDKSDAALFDLPEKILQFGAGVLLRGLPDCLIDRANRQGIFNGRVVVVKSTAIGDSSAFERQDNLYTICTRGLSSGRIVHENAICAAISRVLSAKDQWQEILNCAANEELEIVISNTTEVGIQLVREHIRQGAPASFPGKLLAFLYRRFRVFHGDINKGMVIVPTELIPDNGKRLEAIVLELAQYNQLEYAFIEWLKQACTFCDSLVDRIVPGAPPAEKANVLYAELGYHDELLTIAEPYCFWAIQGDERVAGVLSFHLAHPDAVVITPDVSRYRERKLRLLNGTHTLCCALAHLAGFSTVAEAMNDARMSAFAERLMLREIAPVIPGGLPANEAKAFGVQVLDRFRNPFVEHRWLSIAAQYASKMRMRVAPMLYEHYKYGNVPPQGMALGFAAFLLFYNQETASVPDDAGALLRERRASHAPGALAEAVLSDTELWGSDLTELSGFADAVTQWIDQILEQGARQALHSYLAQGSEVESNTILISP